MLIEVDLTRIKPYGDTLGDGKVQVSFTLPVPASDEAQEAARLLCEKMGMEDPQVVYMKDLGEGFSFFVVYGAVNHTVDFTKIVVPKVDVTVYSKQEIVKMVEEQLGREVVVVGACIESDAHTVGIDAILNMKGYNGHKGLESYHGFRVYNMGAQVPCEELIRKAVEVNADAILVSQVVTQKNIHIQQLTKLIDLLEAEGLRDRFILAVGGPRISHELAKELGYDAGFGPGTYAEDVASFIVDELLKKKEVEEPLSGMVNGMP